MLDVSPETGHIKLNFAAIEDMAETCSLDVADRGGTSRIEVAELLGKTRERVRQHQATGQRALGRVLDLESRR